MVTEVVAPALVSHRSAVGAIVGGVVGGVIALLLLLLLCFYFLQRRGRRARYNVPQRKQNTDIDPFVEAQPFYITEDNSSHKETSGIPGGVPVLTGTFYSRSASEVTSNSQRANGVTTERQSAATSANSPLNQNFNPNLSTRSTAYASNELSDQVEQEQIRVLTGSQLSRQATDQNAVSPRSETEELRDRITSLQADVERLQAGQEELVRERVDPLPSYNELSDRFQ